MNRTATGERRAREIAERAMTQQSYSIAAVAREAGVDPGTVGDFIGGKRWPRREKLAAIERALLLSPGTLANVADSESDPQPSFRSAPRTSRPNAEQGGHAADALVHQLHPGLRRFNDGELYRELQVRTLLYAARLTALGDSSLSWAVADDGGDEMVSGPPRAE